MNLLRSLLFLPLFYGWTVLMVIGCLPTLLGPWRLALKAQETWAGGVLFLARTVLRIRYEIRGREHLLQGCALVASKHQSAWETIAFQHIL
ncbi:MAG: 1-acyl-sn-glycerol-3-phosphate acyltransferase, partial [Alphaproteobacteria bacterium]|nr:1-acyl-sn-glycerol-3-phosphate acyltransferase [Alphaproteobacteria bacterium]